MRVVTDTILMCVKLCMQFTGWHIQKGTEMASQMVQAQQIRPLKTYPLHLLSFLKAFVCKIQLENQIVTFACCIRQI